MKPGSTGSTFAADLDRLIGALACPRTLQNCAGDLERMAGCPSIAAAAARADLNSAERQKRIAAEVESGGSVAEEDRWAAFNLSAGRADVPRVRGQVREAAQYSHEAMGMVIDMPPGALGTMYRRSDC